MHLVRPDPRGCLPTMSDTIGILIMGAFVGSHELAVLSGLIRNSYEALHRASCAFGAVTYRGARRACELCRLANVASELLFQAFGAI